MVSGNGKLPWEGIGKCDSVREDSESAEFQGTWTFGFWLDQPHVLKFRAEVKGPRESEPVPKGIHPRL